MNSAAYDYSFSPHVVRPTGFAWEYAQQRNVMTTKLDDIEKDLLQQSAEAQLYAFTRTVNSLPREQAGMINHTVLKQIAENLRRMPVSNDARMSAMNIYYSKFGRPS
jgi:hypothetical protein